VLGHHQVSFRKWGGDMIDTQTPRQAPVAEVGEQLCLLAGQIAAATSRFLGLLADFDARQGWAGPGVHSCAHWLSWRCGMDLRTSREHVRVARSLVVLPRTAAEFTEGRLSYSKVRAIARVATPHPRTTSSTSRCTPRRAR